MQETDVWVCRTDTGCNGWIRENFSFEKNPQCPLCGSDMIRGTKLLPVLHNETKESGSEPVWRKRRGII